MKVNADSTTAVISFQAVKNEVGTVTRLSVADLRTTVDKLASILRERLMPLLQQRGVDLTSEIEQSRTFLATYITAGINRVLLQVMLAVEGTPLNAIIHACFCVNFKFPDLQQTLSANIFW